MKRHGRGWKKEGKLPSATYSTREKRKIKGWWGGGGGGGGVGGGGGGGGWGWGGGGGGVMHTLKSMTRKLPIAPFKSPFG